MENIVPNLKPLLIIGPSGAGKGTLISRLLSDYRNIFEMSVSYTTRSPRDGEQNGVDRHFISKQEYDRCLSMGEFLSHGCYCGNYYATKQSVLDSIAAKGKICLFENAIEGVEMMHDKGAQFNYLFVLPPSFEELRRRLKERGSESDEQINRRIEVADNEIHKAENLEFITLKLINDDFEHFYEKVRSHLTKWYPQFDFTQPK